LLDYTPMNTKLLGSVRIESHRSRRAEQTQALGQDSLVNYECPVYICLPRWVNDRLLFELGLDAKAIQLFTHASIRL